MEWNGMAKWKRMDKSCRFPFLIDHEVEATPKYKKFSSFSRDFFISLINPSQEQNLRRAKQWSGTSKKGEFFLGIFYNNALMLLDTDDDTDSYNGGLQEEWKTNSD